MATGSKRRSTDCRPASAYLNDNVHSDRTRSPLGRHSIELGQPSMFGPLRGLISPAPRNGSNCSTPVPRIVAHTR